MRIVEGGDYQESSGSCYGRLRPRKATSRKHPETLQITVCTMESSMKPSEHKTSNKTGLVAIPVITINCAYILPDSHTS